MLRDRLWVFLFLAGCGLTRPLADDSFQLHANTQEISQKDAYLAQPAVRLADAPNIIWIIADDLGIADTDLYGEGTVPVPNMNKLADQGVRFSNAYVTSAICGPSRAAIFTGRYNQRFGFEHQQHDRYLKNKLEYLGFKYFIHSKPWYPQKQDSVPTQAFIEEIGLPKSEITIAEVLKKHGYTTGLFGKWHLSRQEDDGPNNFGFDTYYGFRNSHSLYAKEDNAEVVDTRNKKDWTDKYIWRSQRDGLSAIELNGVVIDEDRYLTKAITDEGIDFIKSAKAPFFAIFSYSAPHTPLQAPQDTYDQWSQIKDPAKRTYAAMINTLDNEIGRIIDYLESTNQLNNTLICFVSDNGGAEYTLATDNGNFKGGKITNFDGGLKVPMFITWPDHISPNSEFSYAVSAMDLFGTTVAQITSENVPRVIDGNNLLTSIDSNTAPHDYLYFRRGYNHGIRSAEYKLTWNTTTGDSLLYNTKNDPFEKENIYATVSASIITSLDSAYLNWSRGVIDPLWPSMIDYRFKDVDGKIYTFDN